MASTHAIGKGVNGGLHLHCFQYAEFFLGLDLLAYGCRDTADHRGNRSTDLFLIGRVSLGALAGLGLNRAVEDDAFAGAAIEFKGQGTLSVFVGFGNVNQFNDEIFTLFDFNRNFLAGLKAVEECRRWKHSRVTKFLHVFIEVAVNLRVHQVRVEIVVTDGALEAFFQIGTGRFEVHFFGAGSGDGP
jgi:hypothetical protein